MNCMKLIVVSVSRRAANANSNNGNAVAGPAMTNQNVVNESAPAN